MKRTRAESTQAPVAYEIPREVVAEGIVNAVAHRDYASNGSVQVMLFADRLEVWNPGRLPSTLTLERLREPHGSVPHNPLLAEPLYLKQYIERMGTGTGDMIRRCREAGLKEPVFRVTDGFTLIIPRLPESAAKTAVSGLGEKLGKKLGGGMHSAKGVLVNETRSLIMRGMLENPNITIVELARILGISTTAVEKNIHFLKAHGLVKRVGPAKGGRWEVLK